MPREALAGEVVGPVILESSDTTIVIPPQWHAVPDPIGSIIASLD